MNDRWKIKTKPASLEARFNFDSFDVLREFLDAIAEKAESLNHHPNISFGREHVSVIIYSQSAEIDDTDRALADSMDESFHQLTQTN